MQMPFRSVINIMGIFAGFISAFFLLQGCGKNPQSPGYEYMPEMYRSPSYETYGENAAFPDSMEARNPVKGTIPRGHMPYGFPNTNAGYDSAGVHLKNPYTITPEMIAEGEQIFKKFCAHCHGPKGMGDGTLINNGKFPPPPAYSGQLKDLPEGKMFHSITYGKNLMGSHASQLTAEERWKVISYIQTLQKAGTTAPSDTTKAATENPAETKAK